MATATKPARKTPAKAPAKPRTRKAAAPKTGAAKTIAAKPAAAKAPRTVKAAPPARKSRFGLISAITAGVIAAGAAAAYTFRRYLIPGNAEHAAPDLALDAPRPDGTQRAPDAFRPDPTAAVPASEREGLRPAAIH